MTDLTIEEIKTGDGEITKVEPEGGA